MVISANADDFIRREEQYEVDEACAKNFNYAFECRIYVERHQNLNKLGEVQLCLLYDHLIP